MRTGKRRVLSLFLAAAVLCLTAFPAAAESASAAAMQLMKTQGAVDVTNGSGRGLTKRDNMHLYNGYHVKTGAASYAWIDLDSTKLTKLDAVSEVEVRKSGKKLELLVSSGNLFFNVTRPLEEGETLNVRTATMVVGIRGTCGWLKINDRWSTEISVLEGTVQCNVTDPVTGQVKTASVQSGERAVATVYPQGQAGDKCGIVQEKLEPGDIGGFVLEELARDPGLCGEILRASGLDVLDAIETSRERLEQDQQEMQEILDRIVDQQTEQDSGVSTGPVWGQEDSAPAAPPSSGDSSSDRDDRNDRDDGGSGGVTAPPPAEDQPPAVTPPPAEENSPSEDNTGGSGGNGETDPPAGDEGRYPETLSDWQTAADIQNALNAAKAGTVIFLEMNDGKTNDTLTINNNMNMIIPEGVTMSVTGGIGVVIESGSTLTVKGTIVTNEEIQNSGTIENELSGLISTTSIISSGTFESSGEIEGSITITSGDFTMHEGMVKGNITLSGSTFIMEAGTINGDISKDDNSTFIKKGGTVNGNVPDSSTAAGEGETVNGEENGPAAG